jgi:hypothetical protein
MQFFLTVGLTVVKVELDPIQNQTRFEIWKLENLGIWKIPSLIKPHKKISSKFKQLMQPKSKGFLQFETKLILN